MYTKKILPLLLVSLTFANAMTKEEEDNANSRSQQNTNITQLQQMAESFKAKEAIDKARVADYSKKYNIPIRQEFKDGRIIEIQEIKKGIPLYYGTQNEDAAISTRTDYLWSAPFEVTGKGYTNLGEWDGGAVRGTHDELKGRVTQVDGATSLSDHSTHVAGTLIASGQDSEAKGMAYEANLSAYDWNSDNSEMATAASNGMEISNHSYGYVTGWYGSNYWFGDISIAQNEAYTFGFYASIAKDWDEIAYNAPNYLIVKSAGNDRNDEAPAAGTEHTHNGKKDANGNYFTDSHNSDGFDNGGFDTIPSAGIAKNVLTVGAVDDVTGFNSPNSIVMSSFSGWGPADDGRIKPDIVANGIGLKSSIASSDTAYGSYNGTSMASPNVTGTLALLQQYYKSKHGGVPMRSATLKALVLHTADEAGSSTGPDYKYGWGLLNAKRAAEKIKENDNNNVIDELTLSDNIPYTRNIIVGSNVISLKATIVWTDPAGTPVPPALDPRDKMLVNDLDLNITKGGATYYPWKLDPLNPSNAATNNSKNHVDNIEQVLIENPTAGTYTIGVSNSGTLSSDQNFSIVISSVTKGVIPETILSENFEEGVIPSNWSVYDHIADSVKWGINTNPDINLTNKTNGSGDCAAANSDKNGEKAYDTRLRTPLLNLSNYSTVSLAFTANYENFENKDKFDVDISSDGGTTWVTKMHWNEDHISTNVSLDLTSLAAGKNKVMIRFRYYNPVDNAYDWDVEIDDVNISGIKNSSSASLIPIIMYLLD